MISTLQRNVHKIYKHQFVVLLSETDKHFMFYPEGIP